MVPSLVYALQKLRDVSEYTNLTDYVLFSLYARNEPCSIDLLRSGFNRMMRNIGIKPDERKKRNLSYHSMRHTFVTLARVSGLPDITAQALAGHKSSQMMERYSHGEKVIDFQEVLDKMKFA